MFDTGNAITVVMAGVGAVIWAVRLEGKFSSHEKEDKLIHEHLTEKLDDMKQDLKDLKTHFGVKTNGKSAQV